MFKRHIGFGIFWFSTGGSRNILKGAATNEILAGLTAQHVFVGWFCMCV